MFGSIRLVIGFIFLAFSVIVISKTKASCKRALYVVAVCFSVLLTTVLMFLPFENAFMTFDSAEEAYSYVNFGKSEATLVVEGNDSDLVVEREDDVYKYLIVPKTEDGWQVGIGSDTKMIEQRISEDISVHVYQYKDTNDYFITVLDTNGGALEISDSCSSEFIFLETANESVGKTFFTYYAHISEFNAEYCINANGVDIIFQNG